MNRASSLMLDYNWKDLCLFSFTVTQLNGSALGALKHHYFTKRIYEILIGNSRFSIHNSQSMDKLITLLYGYKRNLPFRA